MLVVKSINDYRVANGSRHKMSFFYAVEDGEAAVAEGPSVSQPPPGSGARMCCDVFGPYELRAPPLSQHHPSRDDLRDLDRDRWIPQIDPTGLDERLGHRRRDDQQKPSDPQQQDQQHPLQQQHQQQSQQPGSLSGMPPDAQHNDELDLVVERGIGPFLMRYRKQVGPHRLYSCRFARVKGARCHAYAILTHDGGFVRRKHAHNHRPEPTLPIPLDRGLRLPPPPSFEEASAVLLTGNMRAFPRPPEEFATSMPVWNTDRTELVETEITEENCQRLAKKATMEVVDGKKVYHCPVPECSYTFATLTNVYGHMRLHVRGHRIRNSGKAPEKLCPLCRQEQGDHARLVRHIVDDHGQRLECTEHEFENVAAFKRWKKLTEEQDLSTFIIGKPQWRQLAGQYSCLRSGRIAGEAADWAARRKLGVECPAAMVVTKAPHSERILVTYWRTHIGHKPSLLDFGLSVETQMWIKDLVERGYKRRAIILEGAKRYFGQNLSRVHCLDNNLFQIVFKKYGVDDKNGSIDVPVKVSDNINYLRVFLARNIHDHLSERALGGADVEGKVYEEKARIDPHDTIKPGEVRVVLHRPSGHYHLDGLNNQKVCKKENITTVVFPRKSPHVTCERRCDECGVCVHRYGCTCRTYMYMDRMCPHIHVVAGKQGNPGPEWVEESLAEDTIGLPECLRRLHRLNYRERMVTLQPLIDEFVDLLKGDHNVDLDQLESVLRSGLEVMRSSKASLQSTRDDEARRCKALEVKKMRKSCRKGEPDFEVIISPGKEAELRERQMEESQAGKVPSPMGVFVPMAFHVKREPIVEEVTGEDIKSTIDTEVKTEATEEENSELRGVKRRLTEELQATPDTTWQFGELILPDGTKQSGYVAKVNRPPAGSDVVTLQPRLSLPTGAGAAVLKVRAPAPTTSQTDCSASPATPRGRPIVVRSSRKGPATLRRSGGPTKGSATARLVAKAATAEATVEAANNLISTEMPTPSQEKASSSTQACMPVGTVAVAGTAVTAKTIPNSTVPRPVAPVPPRLRVRPTAPRPPGIRTSMTTPRLVVPMRTSRYTPMVPRTPGPTACVAAPGGPVKAFRPTPITTPVPKSPRPPAARPSPPTHARVYSVRAIAPTSGQKPVRVQAPAAQTMIVRASVAGVGMNPVMQRPAATATSAKKESGAVKVERDTV
ncbi:uncharacterized protein LOC111248335 isoform X2 [Varroa destructor]|uniref:C2H2-type domain-containing protein n=1 Tax=Varroa destructor TaxID=109461 RepID=A0A7M7K1S6_VARDE|nr:uncharacterized protein LOC111248335 isoform X2 [Varroa destructor]